MFLTATFLGHTLAKHDSKRHLAEKESKLLKYIDFFVWTLVLIVFAGYIRQAAKLLFPNFFLSIGYGPLNDFAFGVKPPLYYLT